MSLEGRKPGADFGQTILKISGDFIVKSYKSLLFYGVEGRSPRGKITILGLYALNSEWFQTHSLASPSLMLTLHLMHTIH